MTSRTETSDRMPDPTPEPRPDRYPGTDAEHAFAEADTGSAAVEADRT